MVPAPTIDYGGMARAVWATAKPERRNLGAVVTELSSARLVGEGGIFEPGPHVPVTHLGYFKPPPDALLMELRSKERRSAREWEYLNAIGVWTEVGLTALEVARTHDGTIEDLTRKLAIDEDYFKGVLEVVSMRDQYIRDITEQGVEIARQMSSLVEQGNDAVFSKSYRSARDALTSKMERKQSRCSPKRGSSGRQLVSR